MSKILITGVAGLIGSNFAHYLLRNTDHTVIGIDDLSGGVIENLPKSDRFTFIKGDAATEVLNQMFEAYKPDYVCHFSCWAAECASPFMRKHSFYTNNMVGANVVNNCINYNVKRLLFTSTMAVYGHGDGNPPFPETLVPAPVDTYGIGKYALEMDIKVAGEQHGLDWVIIRPHNVYGARQTYFDRYRNVLGIWMFKHLQGLPFTIFGDGLQKRAFSYIDDSLPCFYKALFQENCSKQIINVGGIQEYTIVEAAHTLRDVIGSGEIVHLEPRHEVKYAYPTYQKSVDLLGFEHKTELKDGLTKMWDWVRDDYSKHKRKQLSFDSYEIDKGIYSFWSNDNKKQSQV